MQCRRPRKIPWRSQWPLIPVFLPGKSYEQSSLVDCGLQSMGSQKSWIRLIDKHNNDNVIPNIHRCIFDLYVIFLFFVSCFAGASCFDYCSILSLSSDRRDPSTSFIFKALLAALGLLIFLKILRFSFK